MLVVESRARATATRWLLALPATALLWSMGCATARAVPVAETERTASARPTDAAPADIASAREARPAVPDVPTPRRYTEAESLLDDGFQALERGDDAAALGALRAVLRSDFLSPRGRAHVYWSAAGAARRVGDDESERGLLEGFLLVRETLSDDEREGDEALALQASIARGVLLAHQVQSRGRGRAPESALIVEEREDTRAAIRALGCGESGEAALVLVDEERAAREGGVLLRRQVRCAASDEQFSLWFDVSSALARAHERASTSRQQGVRPLE